MDGEVIVRVPADKKKLAEYRNKKGFEKHLNIIKLDKMGRKKRNPSTYSMSKETADKILDERTARIFRNRF